MLKHKPAYTVVTLLLATFLVLSCTRANLSAHTDVPGFQFKGAQETFEAGRTVRKEYFESDESSLIIIINPEASVTGVLVAVGTSHFNQLTLQTPEGKAYYLPEEVKERLWPQQGERITLTGRSEKRVVENRETGRTITRLLFFPDSVQ